MVEGQAKSSYPNLTGFCIYGVCENKIYTHYVSAWVDWLNKTNFFEKGKDPEGNYLKESLPDDVYMGLYAKILESGHTGKTTRLVYPFSNPEMEEEQKELSLSTTLHIIGQDRDSIFCYGIVAAVARREEELVE